MNIYKYNLFINNSFDSYKFINNKDESLFNVIDSNLLEYSIFLTPSSKPENSTDYITLNINDIEEFYIYPTSVNNVSISVNEVLQTSDNNAIFIITNYIEENKFSLKLVQCVNGLTYNLYNNIKLLLYNNTLEDLFYSLNNNKSYLITQKNNYTNLLNSGSTLSNYINSIISLSTDYTNNYKIDINFSSNTTYNKIISIIDKFYINIQIYSYNDFKYIYYKDLSLSENNYTLSSTSNITGILKTFNTKIIPHEYFKLELGKQYTFTSDIINNYTSYKKQYEGEKLLYLFQLSLNNKSTLYDISNNVESDLIYIIK